jgi:carboxyl-terminal processing protease
LETAEITWPRIGSKFPSTSSRDKQDPGAARGFGGLGIDLAAENGRVKVVSAMRGAPAAQVGVTANDIITHLDDEPLQGLPLDRVIEKMRGPVNTKIRLRIVRKG